MYVLRAFSRMPDPAQDDPPPDPDDPDAPVSPVCCSVRVGMSMMGLLTLLMTYLMLYQMAFVINCMVIDEVVHSRESCPSLVRLNVTSRVNSFWMQRKEMEDSSLPFGSETHGEFLWGPGPKGIVQASFMVGFMFALVAGGLVSDQFGGKWVMIGGTLGSGLFSMACPEAARAGYVALTFVRIVQGFFSGVCLPAYTSTMTKWATPKERTVLMGWAWIGVPASMAVLYPMSSGLCEVDVDNGWPLVFYVSGSMAMALSLLQFLFVEEWPENHRWVSGKERAFLEYHIVARVKEKIKTPWGILLSSPAVLAYWTCYVAQAVGFTVVCAFTPSFMKDVLKFDVTSNGVMSAVPFFTMMAVRFCISTTFHSVREYFGVSLTNMRKVYHAIGILVPSAALVGLEWVTCHTPMTGVALLTINVGLQDFAFSGGFGFCNGDFAPAYSGVIAGTALAIGTFFAMFLPIAVSEITKHHTHDEWMVVYYFVCAVNLVALVVFNKWGTSELQPWGRGVKREQRPA